MITGTTENGFQYSVPEDVLDDMELFEALVDVDKGNKIRLVDVATLVLRGQKEELYTYLKLKHGRVKTSEVFTAVMDILYAAKHGKKS